MSSLVYKLVMLWVHDIAKECIVRMQLQYITNGSGQIYGELQLDAL